jgi:hypothetical protein
MTLLWVKMKLLLLMKLLPLATIETADVVFTLMSRKRLCPYVHTIVTSDVVHSGPQRNISCHTRDLPGLCPRGRADFRMRPGSCRPHACIVHLSSLAHGCFAQAAASCCLLTHL